VQQWARPSLSESWCEKHPLGVSGTTTAYFQHATAIRGSWWEEDFSTSILTGTSDPSARSSGTRYWMPLVQERDEASGPAHIFFVGLAQSRDERGFLNGYSVCVGSPHADKKGEKSCPVSERQTQSDECDKSAHVGGMADVAIRSHLNDRLARVNRYFISKKPPQNRHGVETKSHPREHEGDSDEEERSSLPRYGRFWEEKGERKI